MLKPPGFTPAAFLVAAHCANLHVLSKRLPLSAHRRRLIERFMSFILRRRIMARVIP
jgi:hypothetical protein